MAEKFTFYRVRVHDPSDLQGWYLRLDATNHNLHERMHRAVCINLYLKYGVDPHLYNQVTGQPMSTVAMMTYNPVKLGAAWFESTMKALFKNPYILINVAGGFIDPPEQSSILSQIEKDHIEFPEVWPDEWITLSRWADGKHFYLSSNKGRIFVPEKYNSRDAAMKHASIFVNKSNIVEMLTETMKLRKPGD